MGVFDALTQFNHKAEIRESKDEMLVGEIVRAMSRQGATATQFLAHADRQQMRFRMAGDPVLSNVYVVLDRKTGGGMVSGAVLGSKATLSISGEVKNYIADPDDLVAMYRTDLANLFKLPVMGGIRLNHEMNSIFAHTTLIVEIDDYVLKGEPATQHLVGLLQTKVGELREALRAHKKG